MRGVFNLKLNKKNQKLLIFIFFYSKLFFVLFNLTNFIFSKLNFNFLKSFSYFFFNEKFFIFQIFFNIINFNTKNFFLSFIFFRQEQCYSDLPTPIYHPIRQLLFANNNHNDHSDKFFFFNKIYGRKKKFLFNTCWNKYTYTYSPFKKPFFYSKLHEKTLHFAFNKKRKRFKSFSKTSLIKMSIPKIYITGQFHKTYFYKNWETSHNSYKYFNSGVFLLNYLMFLKTTNKRVFFSKNLVQTIYTYLILKCEFFFKIYTNKLFFFISTSKAYSFCSNIEFCIEFEFTEICKFTPNFTFYKSLILYKTFYTVKKSKKFFKKIFIFKKFFSLFLKKNNIGKLIWFIHYFKMDKSTFDLIIKPLFFKNKKYFKHLIKYFNYNNNSSKKEKSNRALILNYTFHQQFKSKVLDKKFENLFFFKKKLVKKDLNYLSTIRSYTGIHYTFENALTNVFRKFKTFFLTKLILQKTYINFFDSKYLFNFKLYSFLVFLPEKYLFSFAKRAFRFNNKKRFTKYSNLLPIYYIPKMPRNFFKQMLISRISLFNIYLWYLVNISEIKLKKKFFYKVFSLHNFLKRFRQRAFFKYIRRNFSFFKFKVGKNFFFNEIFEVLWLVFLFKDTSLFMSWFVWTLSSIHYKKVKTFLFFLKTFLVNYLLPHISKVTGVRGFFFDIRGKVGVTGDAKKRHVQISWGKSSYTTKNIKFSLKQGLVHSKTGVMGVTVVITF